MTKDYRLTVFCPPFENIIEKKKEFLKHLKQEHPLSHNHYKYIREMGGTLKKDFLLIYNGKCAYCGGSIQFLHIVDFQVDHYKNEASFVDKNTANNISNLVAACSTCNGLKSGFTIDGKYLALFNIDNLNIAKVFVRNNDYSISIATEHFDDDVVQAFYKQIKLDRLTIRLDFLLLNLIELCKTLNPESEHYSALSQAKDILLEKSKWISRRI